MTDLSRDPIINIIHNGIKKGVRIAIESQCYGSAVILIFSGMDTMAYLAMPEGQEDVTRKDFVKWVEGYIKFPCEEQLTGLDLYGARCGMLHTYGIASKLSREGKCRQIGYADKMVPEIRFDPSVSDDLVIVSVEALAEAFFKGVDNFMVDLFADSEKGKVADKRFRKLVYKLPYEKAEED